MILQNDDFAKYGPETLPNFPDDFSSTNKEWRDKAMFWNKIFC